MIRRLPVFVLGVACFGLCGCASSTTRARQEKFSVLSDPKGAHVLLSNGATDTTPAHFVIQSESDLTVTLSKEGYETVVIPVCYTKKIDRAKVALLLPLAAITLPVVALPIALGELASGEAPFASHQPNPVKVKLKPLTPADRESANPANDIARLEDIRPTCSSLTP